MNVDEISVGIYVIKLVVCNHIRFNKVAIEKLLVKLKTIILNPINLDPEAILSELEISVETKMWIKFEYIA